MSPPPINSYEVGWICALPHELAAARAMLDEDYGLLKHREAGDDNTYAIGRIHEHNVVIACLPAGIDGTSAAAVVAQNMRRTFPHIRIGLLVGIGGGIPDLDNGVDIRLGDVVVSQPAGEYGGVIQYAKGKLQEDKVTGDQVFVRKGSLNKPPMALLNALAMLQAYHESDDSEMATYLEDMLRRKPTMRKKGYGFPGNDKDHFFGSTRNEDNRYTEIDRSPRDDEIPAIHYGNIASGDFVVKNAEARDSLRDKLGVKCVEMEAAGLQDTFPCLVIRGICDYADSFKNDVWHRYAAATAAAYAKEFLFYVSSDQVHQSQSIQEVMGQVHDALKEEVQTSKAILEETRLHYKQEEERQQTDEERRCIQAFKIGSYEQYKDINQDRVPGTCRWVLEHPHFRRWFDSAHDDLLWISADPGCGKSVLAKSLIDNELAATSDSTTCYYFFKDNDTQNQLAPALCAVLHQLFSSQPHLLKYAIPAWKKTGNMIQSEVESMWGILLTATMDDTASPVVCVLDALDECRDEDRKMLVTRLCQFLEDSTKTTKRGNLKFLVTSRPYDNVERWFENLISSLPQLRLRGEDENDLIRHEIDLVIDVRLRNLSIEFNLSKNHQDSLRQRLQKMEHRTYLWLYLAMDDIRTQYRDSLDPEEEVIQDVPVSVENAYEKILQRITDNQKSHARRVLSIIVGARRPLTIGEVSLACNAAEAYEKGLSLVKEPKVSHFEKRVRQWCGLFVFINHSKLFLIHLTAKDFLLSDLTSGSIRLGNWKSSFSPMKVESELAMMCITYLHLTMLPRGVERLEWESSFGWYCVENWTAHFSNRRIGEAKLLDIVLELCDTGGIYFSEWFPTMWKARHGFELPSLYDEHAIAMIGNPVILVERHKRQPFDVDIFDGHGQTALMWASELGHVEVVRTLVNMGADVNKRCSGMNSTALQAASMKGHVKVIQTLLQAGADVNAKGGFYGTAISAASAKGHEEAVQMLIENDADVNAKGGLYGTALHVASIKDHDTVIRTLLDNGANVNAKDRWLRTVLHVAIINRYEKRTAQNMIEKGILQMLLDKGVDINAVDSYGRSALQLAWIQHDPKMVQTLLTNGADARDLSGRIIQGKYRAFQYPLGPDLLRAIESDKDGDNDLTIDSGSDSQAGNDKASGIARWITNGINNMSAGETDIEVDTQNDIQFDSPLQGQSRGDTSSPNYSQRNSDINNEYDRDMSTDGDMSDNQDGDWWMVHSALLPVSSPMLDDDESERLLQRRVSM